MDTRKITASDHNEILSLMKKMSDFFSSETIEYAQEKIDSLVKLAEESSYALQVSSFMKQQDSIRKETIGFYG